MEEIINQLIKFRDERQWDKFHNAKDLAVAISVEAAELLELFLWKDPDEVDSEKVKDELADVLSYSLLLAEKYNFNISDIILDKIKTNTTRYPIEKSKGSAKKYNEL